MAFPLVFVTDFHGIEVHYQRLFDYVRSQNIKCLVFGGDICPSGYVYSDYGQIQISQRDFLEHFFLKHLRRFMNDLPNFRCLVIMGNDDLRANMDLLDEAESDGVLNVIHQKIVYINDLQFLGYSCIPPSPFLIKDWEKYENSNRIIEPIAIPPGRGYRSTQINDENSIETDLALFHDEVRSNKTIFISHCPPYKTKLDQSTKNRYYEGLRLDNHLGSIAIRNFIESAQPILSLHGHIHESTSISGQCFDDINGCLCLNGSFEIENTKSTQILLIDIGGRLSFKKLSLT